MKISFAIVVYVCIWFMTLFAVLPFRRAYGRMRLAK